MKRAIIIGAVLMLWSLEAVAQVPMMGGKRPKPFTHPKGFYGVAFPRGWTYELKPNGQLVAVGGRGTDQATFTVTMSKVPAGVDPEMVALNAGRKLKKLPHFKDGGGGRLTMAGKPASIHSFEFDYQGNTEYRIVVEELYIVSGSVLYTFHFEVMRRSFPKTTKDLKMIYDSIMVAEIDADGKPFKAVRAKRVKGRDHLWVPAP